MITIAITVAVAITVTCVWHWRGTYTTAAGEWRVVSLHDGSVIRLGPRTEIKVRYDREQRLIEQFSGEATYEVAKV
ncbi:MAG TPA: FecR domain-containing protein [Steroidobacter sp.]|uniref:FecR domain-containing protein n=1 Tax=Steroidobacter sp. TaxID=1978227 RepID=UPI002ED9F333